MARMGMSISVKFHPRTLPEVMLRASTQILPAMEKASHVMAVTYRSNLRRAILRGSSPTLVRPSAQTILTRMQGKASGVTPAVRRSRRRRALLRFSDYVNAIVTRRTSAGVWRVEVDRGATDEQGRPIWRRVWMLEKGGTLTYTISPEMMGYLRSLMRGTAGRRRSDRVAPRVRPRVVSVPIRPRPVWAETLRKSRPEFLAILRQFPALGGPELRFVLRSRIR